MNVQGLDINRTKIIRKIRNKQIGKILKMSDLDVILLQEVTEAQMEDLQPFLINYEVFHQVHANRQAKDGVAVCLKKDKFDKSTMTEHGFQYDGYSRNQKKENIWVHYLLKLD
eukprot:UN01000